MLPRVTTQKIPGHYGLVWLSEAIAASKPDGVRNVLRLFERQPTETRRKNAYKSTATRMAMKFAAMVGQ